MKKTIISWCQKFNILHERFQGARKHKLNKSYFASIDSEEKAYWLGFLMADGCVYKGSSKNSYRLQINLSFNDRDCLEKLNESIESDYDIKDKYVYLKSTD